MECNIKINKKNCNCTYPGCPRKGVCCECLKYHLKNKSVCVIINLVPRKMKGIESQGMILAAVNKDESSVILISPEKEIDFGSKVR